VPARQVENGRSYGFKGKGFGLAWGAASTPPFAGNHKRAKREEGAAAGHLPFG